LSNIDDEEWDFVMDVNLKGRTSPALALNPILDNEVGVMNCMRAELGVIGDSGFIVNAASICGLIGMKGCTAYCANKHAVIGLTRAAAKEVGERQIRVNAIAP
jgi:NAD(P)-dependent dehydrogenase (short-subunit alcohol dehydrogenase family)